ncbi:hypothetical protein R5R35_005537 [Gryllus longicercus]|uniref:Accessory gland protein n=1 Tax=Gryllus longicercus TaxID=2509291 RepID=A0AAN9VU02_9ORTH
MKTLALCVVAALAACATAEPPSGYSYSRPSGGYSGGGGFGGGGYSGGGGFGGGGGGGYVQEAVGYSTSEGQYVDAELLQKIRQILLREEANAAASGGGGGGGISSSYGAPSTQYGVPSTQYGVPSTHYRVVGIELGNTQQAIQVAQYRQTTYGSGGGYNYAPAQSYGAPSSSYGAPSY